MTANGVAYAKTSFENVGKSAYLIDVATNSVMYARNENERLPIASMVKIMTSLLTFEAIEDGRIAIDDMVEISEKSASMGGSQVFLDAGSKHSVGDLLKTIIVASANDSCVALAEHIDGSVENFVNRMNERAKQLEMNNTRFANCTGLPAAESFSCAKDVAKMFAMLLKHDKYYEYASIWLEDYAHPDGRTTTITNTNKLVRFYKGCDGGKTGFTSEAKFCLSATAKKDDMRVIAVIIGADSSKTRNSAVSSMFDYAFANYKNNIVLKSGENLDNTVRVKAGKKDFVNATVDEDLAIFMSRNDTANYEIKYDILKSVKAPVQYGDVLGKVYLTKDGVVISERNVIANETVDRMSLFDAIKQIAKGWNTCK